MKLLEVKVRPVANANDKLKGAARIYVNKDSLIDLTGGLESGKVCLVELADGQRREATLWPSLDGQIGRAVAQMSRVFQEAAGLKLGDQCKIIYNGSNGSSALTDAKEIVVEEVSVPEGTGPVASDLVPWSYAIESNMGEKEHIDQVFPGLVFKNIYCRGPRRSFRVVNVNGKPDSIGRFVLGTSQVIIISKKAANGQPNGVVVSPGEKLQAASIAGLDAQVKELNRFLSGFGQKFLYKRARQSCGIVLHGGRGSGKSMLVNKLTASGWGTVHRIDPDEKLSTIREVLQKARAEQPSIVTMDGFEQLIDKERSNYKSVTRALDEFLDTLASDAEQNDELPRVVLIVTCLDYMTDIPLSLREPRALEQNIFLPYPDVGARRAILASFDLPVHPDLRDALVTSLSERTHAFNGKDLKRLEARALREGQIQDEESGHSHEDGCGRHYISPAVFEDALKKTVPSAMDGIKTNPPPVHWDDIGGQDSVKTALRRAIRMSRTPEERLRRIVGRPPKGFLLYGPPGCSKTMAAQAMATESALNFFAIKGAELINKYVGESERAIRQLFERARNAAPSMIFFDEIDSIAGQRQGFGSSGAGSASAGGTSHGGLNVLTTLLNEMDGFEAMRGVLVLAATNRPQAMDPALLRPGRFDALIYVAPPDRAAREAIFRRTASRMDVAPDVDIAELAEKTEGCSGAEVAAIFQTAGLSAWERVDSGVETELILKKEDLLAAVRDQKRQITPDMLRAYEIWEREFRQRL